MQESIVMTLDAGGTNFVFSAIQGENEIIEPFVLPSHAYHLEKCLKTIIKGFENVRNTLYKPAVAISFAFPGPADYTNGIIGDLGNLPAFKGGVALGPMLQNHFEVPVFINNDGDLFAFGEAIYGLLPKVNRALEHFGSNKRFKNLFGVTLGTGFGGGLVSNNELYKGDNGAAAEVWLLRDLFYAGTFVEESVSARAITNEYTRLTGMKTENLSPRDIYLIAKGQLDGNRANALASYEKFGKSLGYALCQILTITDGLVVIGGGLANASELFFPAMLNEMNGIYENGRGDKFGKLVLDVFDLNNQESFNRFARGQSKKIKVPFSEQTLLYDPIKRVGIGVSDLGASKAISLGAYAFAVNELRKN